MKPIPKVNHDKEARKKIYSSITYEYENCHSTTMKVYYCWLQIMLFVLDEFLKSTRPPESEIEIELERTWEASRVDLEMVWTRV